MLAAAGGAAAQSSIRVAVVDNARAVELRGTDIEIAELNGEAAGWRSSLVRAAVVGAALEVEGRRGTAFRLRSERPIRLNGREYPATLDIVRSGATAGSACS